MDQTELMNWFLHQEPSVVQDWLKQVFEGSQDVSENFNWQGLADAADVLAKSGSTNNYSAINFEWAKIAITIYQYLINTSHSSKRASLEYRIMLLRAYLIDKLGCVAEDPILDVNQIVDWFFQNLSLSLDEAETRAQTWREREREQILELRYIKNRLSIIQSLINHNRLSPNRELQEWLALREQLP